MGRMSVWCVLGLSVMAAVSAAVAVEPLGHPGSTADWEDLFAADLSDAEYPAGVWSFENGELTATEDQAIWTRDDFENCVIDLEFKNASASNSGVFLYCSDMANWVTSCIEVQILDDHSDKWKDVAPTWRCGGIFGRLAPAKLAVKPAGEWNRYTIRCMGKQVDVVLNGEHVASMDLDKWTSAGTNPDGSEAPSWLGGPLSAMKTKGRIGLQGKHAGAPIWFRNMKVKRLAAARAGERVSLFNGENLDGWKVLRCEAAVDNGDILIQDGNGLIEAEKKYGDFVLEFDWKALAEDNWDSGVYFRYAEVPKNRTWPQRYQANLRKGMEGNVEGLEGAVSEGLIKAGEWNTFKLTVKGDAAALEINGGKAWEAKGLEGPAEGFIALQAEVATGGQHRFRNIHITEL